MKRDIRYVHSRGSGNQNSIEDWLGGSTFIQDSMDSDNNTNFPSSQEWEHYTPWNTSAPHYQVDPKRSPFFSEMAAPQRVGAHYLPYPNMCTRPEAPAPKPGIEAWHYPPGILPAMTANSSSSGIYSSRNSDAFRPPQHAIPVHPFPRPPHHHLFAAMGGGGQIPGGGGPPSLLPPPFIFAHHPSSLPSQAYPPQDRNSRAHSSASLFGTPNSNYQTTMPTVGVSNPDSTNYAEQGCYSLPVTTTACSENHIQVNQMNRPKNQVAVSKASVAPTNSEASMAGKRGCHHRRAMSDPGLLTSALPSECSAAASNVPPPPPPALRLDAWLKGCRFRDSSDGKLDEPSITSSMVHDNNHWFHTSEEKKCQQGAVDKTDEEQTPRVNMSSHSSTASDVCGAGLQPLKLSTTQQAKVICCCNGWSVPMKLVEEVSALKESNRKLARELRETKKELDDLKVMLPNSDSLKHDGSMSWQYPGMDYQPGMIAELVQELREASRLREEAFLSHIHSAVISQGSSCSCGQALLPDGGLSKKKMMCWWWGKSKWSQGKGQQQCPTATTCSSMNSSDIMQADQDDQKKLNMRLRRIEERLNNYKISGDIPRSSSLQETDFHVSTAKGAKIPPIDDSTQRVGVGGSLKEECLNHDIALLKDDIQRLRLQMQDMKATQQGPINQANKIEQLTALLQKVACPSNGISLSGAGSAVLTTLGHPVGEESNENTQADTSPLASKNSSRNDSNSEMNVFSGKTSSCEPEALISSGEAGCLNHPAADVSSSLESDSSNSSCGSNLGITSISSPVTMHGPVTDL